MILLLVGFNTRAEYKCVVNIHIIRWYVLMARILLKLV